MQSSHIQTFNTKAPSFGSVSSPAYRIAEKVVRELTRNEYQSATYFADVRYPKKNFINQHHRGLAILKLAENLAKTDIYRNLICNNIVSRNFDDFYNTFKKLLPQTRLTNCGENAFIVHTELAKQGIPSRVVSDRKIDHSFVVVNRETPFNSYRDKEKGNFIADAWLRKIYRNVDEAYLDYKTRFNAKMKTEYGGSPLLDVTDAPYQYRINANMTTADEAKNKSVTAQIAQITEIIRKIVSCEARTLKKTTSHIENLDDRRIRENFIEDIIETIRRELLNSKLNS